MSTTTVPAAMPPSSPWPSSTSSTSAELGSMRITTPAPVATSVRAPTPVTVPCWATPDTARGSTSYARTGYPAPANRPTMGRPIRPRPTNPTTGGSVTAFPPQSPDVFAQSLGAGGEEGSVVAHQHVGEPLRGHGRRGRGGADRGADGHVTPPGGVDDLAGQVPQAGIRRGQPRGQAEVPVADERGVHARSVEQFLGVLQCRELLELDGAHGAPRPAFEVFARRPQAPQAGPRRRPHTADAAVAGERHLRSDVHGGAAVGDLGDQQPVGA